MMQGTVRGFRLFWPRLEACLALIAAFLSFK